MLGRVTDLSGVERKTMEEGIGDGALDARDVRISSFVILARLAMWTLSRGEADLPGSEILLVVDRSIAPR